MKKEKNMKAQEEAVQESQHKEGFAVIAEEFKRDKIAKISLYAVVGYALFVFIASLLIDQDALNTVHILQKYDAPSFASIWDILGRDAEESDRKSVV